MVHMYRCDRCKQMEKESYKVAKYDLCKLCTEDFIDFIDEKGVHIRRKIKDLLKGIIKPVVNSFKNIK